MRVFLVLSSSGVLFYLVLLFQLYRDGHRNRNRVELLEEIEFDRTSATRFSPAGSGVTAGTHQPKLSDERFWAPVTKFEWKPAKAVAQNDRQRASMLATPGGRVHQS